MSLQLFPDAAHTIRGCADAIRVQSLTASQLLDRCMTQIDQGEDSVRAWVSVDRDEARRVAAERDAESAESEVRGPLHGIPIGIKDIFDATGQVTAAGSAHWAQQPARETDCPVVARLRNAGAVIVGRTVTTQFACFDPPVTRNPWNTDQTPGGSSSGSAAAVATGMCLAAMGSQTGGSITRPAAYCGVTGCKPSFGTVSLKGVVPIAEHLDHPGPIAACVADLAIMLWAIQDSPDERLLDLSARKPRLGRLTGLFDELADSTAVAAVDEACRVFEKNGAEVRTVELPQKFDTVLDQHAIVMAVEAACTHHSHFSNHPDDYEPFVRGLIERGQATAPDDYSAARVHQDQLQQNMLRCFENVDALICPAAVGTAPDRSTTGSPAMNSPWSYTGSPTVSVPVKCDNGLPLAVQFVGAMNADTDLLAAALWCEGALRINAGRDPLG